MNEDDRFKETEEDRRRSLAHEITTGPGFRHLDEMRDLLAVRERHVTPLVEGILAHDHFVVGICARTGSSSAQLLLAEKLEQEGYTVARVPSLPSQIMEDMDALIAKRPEKAVILFDEAKQLEYMITSGEYLKRPQWQERMDDLLTFIRTAKQRNIKLVFFSHDNYGTRGEGGMVKTKKWLRTFPGFKRLKIGTDQLESLTKEEIGRLYDVMIKKYKLPPEFEIFREQVMEAFISPLQVSEFLYTYQSWDPAPFPIEKPESIWRFMYSRMEMHDYFSVYSQIETTGKAQLFDLMLFLLFCDGPIPVSELSKQEAALVARYEKFHFFDLVNDTIDIRGTYVKEKIKEISDRIDREKRGQQSK